MDFQHNECKVIIYLYTIKDCLSSLNKDKNKSEYSYSLSIILKELFNSIKSVELLVSEHNIIFDMDYFIGLLENLDINVYIKNTEYEVVFKEFTKKHKFIRTGWMSSAVQCYGKNDIDYDIAMYKDHIVSNCNWKSSTEECEGSYAHNDLYLKLIDFVFHRI